ncbi:MAG: DUF4388 domain-containing protein [Calditrichaceae bacterium]|nr:DUF4388 domain-containing protein [Calditrichia bacterium]NUQ41186.1 DUF4388 domain-containing protein [Calditrichaceae bacterium]
MALVGSLKDLKLANIIQINCIERNVARVTVSSADQKGAIYFTHGAITHAEFGPYVGERAVHEMLALTDGEFKVEGGLESSTRTVTQPWNSIVLEGLRLIDEKKVTSAPIPRQLFGMLSGLKHVRNVFVLNFNGQVIEGKLKGPTHPLTLTFVWYKVKKLLSLFYADIFQYILLRRKDDCFFIFEFRPNLIVVVETDLKVIAPEFSIMVKKLLKQINSPK